MNWNLIYFWIAKICWKCLLVFNNQIDWMRLESGISFQFWMCNNKLILIHCNSFFSTILVFIIFFKLGQCHWLSKKAFKLSNTKIDVGLKNWPKSPMINGNFNFKYSECIKLRYVQSKLWKFFTVYIFKIPQNWLYNHCNWAHPFTLLHYH